jgi:hypothetical protein
VHFVGLSHISYMYHDAEFRECNENNTVLQHSLKNAFEKFELLSI